MKFMIASDLHGSAHFTKQLLAQFEEKSCDKLLLLGDLLYHGARNDLPGSYAPKEVTAMLNGMSEKILCVRGNCDSEVDQMVMEFPIMAPYSQVIIGDRTLFLTHGHAITPENAPKLPKGSLFLSGHTHVPTFTEKEGVFYANPGSVSIPKCGSERGFLLLDSDAMTLSRFDLAGNMLENHQI
ncbi:MAG: phosphodiesterase [Ruminococcaceae bacterium]|nr:phosphodiesterase [Oscillospiraceae bacterium]